MNFPSQYIDFLYHFHVTRDYFECHESLEELWKSKEEKEGFWIPLIQLSVALYHYRREEYSGAYKLLSKVIRQLSFHQENIENIGLDYEKLYSKTNRLLEELELGLPYQSVNLPIKDIELLKICQNIAIKNQQVWGNHSDMSDEKLIHKHKIRDRSEIIESRLKKLKKK